MKEEDVKLEDTGKVEDTSEFEELVPENTAAQQGEKGNRPDFRVVQVDTTKEGRTIYRNVGGMWKNMSKNGNEFYTLLIGNMKLLVFPNDRK